VQINALLLPPGKMELAFNFGLSSSATDLPIIVTLIDPSDTQQTINTLGIAQIENRNYVSALTATLGLPYDSQVSLNFPFNSKNIFSGTAVNGELTENRNTSNSNLGDIGVTLLKTIAKEKGRRPDLIARLSIDFDTGKTNSAGLGSGSEAVEYTLGLGATKRQDPLVFSYQLTHTISETKDDLFRAGDVTELSLGAILAASPYTSIKLSFSQSVIGKSTIEGEKIDQLNRAPASVSLGTSSVIGRSTFIYSDVTIGLNDSANDYRVSIGISRQLSLF